MEGKRPCVEDGTAGFTYCLEIRNALLGAGGAGNRLGRDKPDGYLLGSYRIATAPEPNSNRLMSFKSIRFDSPANRHVTIECCPQNTPMIPGASSGGGMAWTVLTTIPVPSNATTEWFAGAVSGTFRARISQTVTGGTVTVLAVRPEEQKGSSFDARVGSC